MADSIRETLEQALKDARLSRDFVAIRIYADAITEALDALTEMERDHEAMEQLRSICSAANRMGTREWEFNHLVSALYLTEPTNITRADPADAILGKKK